MGAGGWRVIAVSLSKIYIRLNVRSWWGRGVDAHKGRYFVSWGGSGDSESDSGGGGGGDAFCLLLWLKPRSARGRLLVKRF